MSRKVVLDIPDEMIKGIDEFKNSTNLPDEETAIFRLIKYALSLPSYFKDFDWRKAEKEADEDIREERIRKFSSVDDFLIDLKT